MPQNPYLAALELVQKHSGTSGQAALAKCILSLYNRVRAYAISDILAPLDRKYTACVFAMLHDYAQHGETEELRIAGRWCVDNFPRLMELSEAMSEARGNLQAKWEKERREELKKQYPD